MTDYQQTHWDIAEVGAVCHDECAVAQIKAAALAMRERCAQVCEALKVNRPSDPLANAFDGACETCTAAVRALEA